MANLFETATAAGTFKLFLHHAEQAGMDGALKTAPSLTVFAPTDKALGKLTPEAITALSGTPQLLDNLVRYHVLQGRYTMTDLEGLSTATTLQGEDVQIRVDDDGRVKVDGAHISEADMLADNGVIHAIDTVLVPETAALALQS